MRAAEPFAVALVGVDEPILARLVDAAISDASANEVTAPITTGPEWSPARVLWLKHFHRSRRAGLSGPAGEMTWAILAGDQIVGSARLKRTTVPGVLETGIWLTRCARGRGVGKLALTRLLSTAAALGARGVSADTSGDNEAAIGVLRSLGFDLMASNDGAGVKGVIMF